jgi:hypothetical protein
MARRKKNEDEPIENKDNLNNESDDTFGLPEVEYEPLKRDVPPAETAPEPTPVEPVYERVEERVEEPMYEEKQGGFGDYPEETIHPEEDNHEYVSGYQYAEEKPVWPKVLGIILILLLIGGGVYYFLVYQPDQKQARERERQEKILADKEAAKRREELRLAEIKKQEEQRRLDSLASIPKVGTIETLSGRTGQYYVVVASAVDDDLLTDYANKLVKTGKNVKIIPPFGKTGKFYRLAIEGKESYADAQASADGMKGGEFGDQLWVVRY